MSIEMCCTKIIAQCIENSVESQGKTVAEALAN